MSKLIDFPILLFIMIENKQFTLLLQKYFGQSIVHKIKQVSLFVPYTVFSCHLKNVHKGIKIALNRDHKVKTILDYISIRKTSFIETY